MEHGAATALFAAGVLARLPGLVLWVLERCDLFAPALAGVGLHPARVIHAEAGRPQHILLAMEEGLGVEAMRLVVLLAERLAWAQTAAAALAPDTAPPAGVSALVDRLTNRLGSGRVFRMVPVESDVPEHSVRPVPPLVVSGDAGGHVSWPVTLPHPVRLFRPPQPVQALAALPDRPPAAFIWRRVRRRVRRADGPERIHGEWWLRDGETRAVRDYWAVEDEEGLRYWLFRRGDGTDPTTGDLGWFLHGLF